MTTVSIRDVALRAGVSVGTVSNVLNGRTSVAAATRRRVLDAITGLGYIRNDSARQLRAGRSRTVAMVALDLSNPFFTDVMHGAELAAEDGGVNVMILNSAEDSLRERRHLDILSQQRVLGVLITPVDEAHNAELDQLVERGIPVVLVDRTSSNSHRCSVAVDDVLGGHLAGEHLRQQGHHRVAFAGGPFSLRQVADRHAGLTAALGDDPKPRLVTTPNLSVAAGRSAGRQIIDLTTDERPTAVFCANDLIALGVLQEMTAQGLRVPHDVAIIGYDDIEFAAAAAVPLSSIRQPREQLGRAATQLLLEEVNEPDTHEHRHVVFRPELVIRESSSPAAPTSRTRRR
ncbi:Catabolite control protein [Micromonospora noduli]|uniref:LacI family DNA-binding transcriptional regulator n=1 Tax=Micromonospora noduli TaxID=709876 RepID=UPI000DBFF6A7|nr:LacI family DNA-binding transcriptional regulator [Micromonospora noduli]RAO32643.1 Catabolite control protein [Micromonospora noduli]